MKTTLQGMHRGKSEAAPAVDVVQFAALQLGGETYALDIMRIKGIYHPLRITPVPKAPAFVEGVAELRGTILPIVDLRKRFDLAARSERATKFVLVAIDGRIVGLIVDGVTEVMRVPVSDVRPTPAMAAAGAERYFSGVLHSKGRIVMVIDLDAILTSSEKISLASLGG